MITHRRIAIILLITSGALAQAQAPAELSLPLNKTEASAGWDFDAARAQVVTDEAANGSAFQIQSVRGKPMPLDFTSKETFRPPVILEAEVRLPFRTAELQKGFYRASATLSFVEPGGADAVTHGVAIDRRRFRDDYSYATASRSGSQGNSFQIKPRYTLDDVSPLMGEHLRVMLERTVQQVPVVHERMHRLRVEVRDGSTRMFVDGRLAGDYKGATSPGKAVLTLTDDARVLNLRVRPLESISSAFVPVPLDDFCNATGPGRATKLPAERGRIGEIEGVPFVTSKGFRGEDHLDVGQSVHALRMGSTREGDARECVVVPEEVETTRFTMRVPGRTYRRAWVLAGSDGDPNSVPLLTVRFFKPKTQWVVDATTEIPTYQATSAPGQAKRVAWSAAGTLWLVPIELDAAALAAEPMDCIELTKAIHPYRGYPDPAYYNAFPGGLPSGVHVHGLTLEEAPVWARGTGAHNANLYQDPEKPVWRVLLRNLTSKPLDADVDVTVTDPYGKSSEHHQRVPLKADSQEQEIRIFPPAEMLGLYAVQTVVKVGDFRQSRTGAFLRLPPDTRKATPANSPWGLWSWNGGHATNPSTEENIRILKLLGAINSFALMDKSGPKEAPVSLYEVRKKTGIAPMHYRLEGRQMPAWTSDDPYDPAKYREYAEAKGKETAGQLKLHPDLQYVNVFAENTISLRVTHGMSPWAMGQPWFDYLPVEAARVRAHWLTAKAAFEGVRKHAPGVKFIFGHGAGNFAQPFFQLEDWNADLFDGYGLDLPQFERMPERQPRATEPSLLYFLHHQLKEKGLVGKKEIVHLESYFPPSGPMALTVEQQAESVVRTAVLSLSLGTTKFMRTWADQTSGDGWGSSHYGATGLIDRMPESNPKPATAAFATMTRVLDLAKYDGWLDTGSRSAYCVRFKDDDRLVYAVWTFRGTRPLALTAEGRAEITRYDMHGNPFPVEMKNQQGTVTLSSTPQWLVVRKGAIQSATVGEPTYAEAPLANNRVLENFESRDWKYDPGVFERYQTNHWDMPREPGEMQAGRKRNEQRKSTVFRVELQNPDGKKPMVGFYGVFVPQRPIEIPGKAKALGFWVNGHSAWNRFIYEIEDAKGEKWLSCGTRDAWNCDDIHSWSSINHDGWRYMSFPLPGNAPGDNFREADTTWWGSDAEGIVDLPVKLTRVMIEMRPQMVYADEMLPVKDLSIELDDLTAEYADAKDMTDAPVLTQRSAANVLSEGKPPPLPNPHAELAKTGTGAPPTIAKMYPPAEFYNGTRLYCEIQPVAGAARYRGYVAVYPDGRGAKALAVDQQSTDKMAKTLKRPNELFFDRLRPATPLYFFVTALDADGKESKPSAIRKVVLKDEFPFK
jgi:hypothetical protein